MSQPFFQRFICLLRMPNPQKEELSPFQALPCQLQDKEIHDQANEDDIHQHPGKNDSVSEILFVKTFHSGRAPYLALQLHIFRI